MEPLLRVRGLTKRYAGFELADVSFEIPAGYVMGLVGPNGAGKTTTIKSILGLLRRDDGEIRVAGLDPELDDELRAEGVARELVNRIQRLRKDSGLEITDRIDLAVDGPVGVLDAAGQHRATITGDTLATGFATGPEAVDAREHVLEVDLDGLAVTIALSVATP